ncbi:MAG: amino acid-binding protein, partial [Candidatus Altiarchaeota archaeon]|nr:amino acid-binding protein [Candidatus Altiarchaeota archaeon]
GLLLSNDVEVSMVSVARVLGVDRRVVRSAVDAILGDEKLSSVYGKLSMTPSLREIAPLMGYGAVEIVPTDAAGKGIVAGVTGLISDYGIGIRQVVADDPTFENPELTVVTERPIPRELIDKLLKVEGVKKVVVLS